MDTKKLRQKILDLAIHGKLVPQDPNDEPASVLLERIRAEKERLVKEGKIKKSKASKTSDTPHYEQVPFEVPGSWEWTTLGELFTLQAGKNITAKDISEKENLEHRFPCYGGNGLRGYVCGYNRNGRFPLIGRQGALCGNINLADGLFYATEHAVVVETYCETDVDWAVHTLTHLNLNQYATSTAQPGLSVSTINEVLIPLPPIEEQKRIVNCLNKWFTLIDQIEQGKADLQTTIKQAKSKILDLAIHGKLVPQESNDEPASVLLKRINPKAEITCDNGHCQNLPDGWVWTTVNDISKSILYGVSESAKSEGKYKLLRITDIQNNQVNWGTVPFTDFDDNKVSSYTLHDGDIVFARTGATVGKSYLIKGLSQKAIYASYLIRVRMFDLILPEYVKHFFESGYYWEQIQLSSVGIGQPNVNGTILGKLNIPIPPLAEQHRIVAKIEELFTSLDNIQKALEV